MKLKFAHLADLHLGSFRERKLTNLNFKAFSMAVDKIIETRQDFVLFAGDIFNNPMPSIELVERVVEQLNRLKERNIPVFVIGGSHDYSNLGKSFVSLLDKTGVFKDVFKYEMLDDKTYRLIFTKDENFKLNVVGVLGRKVGLEKQIFEKLERFSLSENYFNVFMFHTTIDDFKPKFMEKVKVEISSNLLPKGFDYYAGGHIHTNMVGEFFGSKISYSGALFPNNFVEFIREEPCFNFCSFDFDTREVTVKKETLKLYEKEYIKFDFNGENPIECKNIIKEKLASFNFDTKIVLLEFSGIVSGKVVDIGLSQIVKEIYNQGAFVILKNSYKLTNKEVADIVNLVDEDSQNIEFEVISEILESQESKEKAIEIIINILKLDLQKLEDEKNADFEKRIIEAFDKSLT